MKRFNRGFTLAEVLIAVGIISVIATLGFTITRKSIERAYDSYIYTGLSALSSAIADANTHGAGLPGTISSDDDGINARISAETQFFNHIAELINAVNYDPETPTNLMTAPNGIQYQFDYAGSYSPNASITKPMYRVRMTVPTKKTSVRSSREEDFLYLPQSEYSQLIPYNFTTSELSTLADRTDLLTYQVDNGTRPGQADNSTPSRDSFRLAACKVHGNIELTNPIFNADVFQLQLALVNFKKTFALTHCHEYFKNASGQGVDSTWENQQYSDHFEDNCTGGGSGEDQSGSEPLTPERDDDIVLPPDEEQDEEQDNEQDNEQDDEQDGEQEPNIQPFIILDCAGLVSRENPPGIMKLINPRRLF